MTLGGKLTVKEAVVAQFLEILRCTFEFVDWNLSQSCLTVAASSFSNTVQRYSFRVFEFIQPLLEEILAIIAGLGFQLREVLH